MQQGSGLEVPLRVIGPDGTVLWQGTGTLGVVYSAICKSAGITESNALMIDPGTTIIQASNLPATGNPNGGTAAVISSILTAKPTTGAAVQGVLGAALNTAAVGAQVIIAGAGSLALVTTGTAGALGQFVVPAASGSTTQSNAGVTGPNQNVGRVIKIAGTTGGTTDTGTASRLGALIDTGSATL